MRDVIVSTEDYSYLDIEAKEYLEEYRGDLQSFLVSSFAPIEYDDKGIIWWTWAGGNINNTLRIILMMELDSSVQVSNEYIKVKNEHRKSEDYEQIIEKISDPLYWEKTETLNLLYTNVPNYHLSKFQPYLPEELKLRLIADTIYDIEGTVSFLNNVQSGL